VIRRATHQAPPRSSGASRPQIAVFFVVFTSLGVVFDLVIFKALGIIG
jgi:hypothetical protein